MLGREFPSDWPLRSVFLILAFMLSACAKDELKEYPAIDALQCAFSTAVDAQNRISIAEHTYRALVKGYDGCKVSLGVRYEKGLGAPVNYGKAILYYNMSPSGLPQLARMAEEGVAQSVNLDKAERLYRDAVHSEVTCAKQNLAEFLERLHRVNRPEIAVLYMDSFFDNFWDAKSSVIRIYQDGYAYSDEQVLRYQNYWFSNFRRNVVRRLRRHASFRQAREKLDDDVDLKIIVSLKKGKSEPRVAIHKSLSSLYPGQPKPVMAFRHPLPDNTALTPALGESDDWRIQMAGGVNDVRACGLCQLTVAPCRAERTALQGLSTAHRRTS
jgi:hypothetical protein